MRDVVRKAHSLLAAQYEQFGPLGMCRVVVVHPDDHNAFLAGAESRGPYRIDALDSYRLETDFGALMIRRDAAVEPGTVRLRREVNDG